MYYIHPRDLLLVDVDWQSRGPSQVLPSIHLLVSDSFSHAAPSQTPPCNIHSLHFKERSLSLILYNPFPYILMLCLHV